MTETTQSASLVGEALLIEPDVRVRQQLKEALQSQGYGVRECADLEEGRREFLSQPLVVAHLNGNTGELRRFVDFVKGLASVPPYVLAVGESTSVPTSESARELGLDAFLAVPLQSERLAAQLRGITQRNGASRTPVAVATESKLPPTEERATESTSELPQESAQVDCSAVIEKNEEKISLPPPRHTGPMLTHFAPTLLDQLPQALALLDTDLRFLVVNRRGGDVWGQDPSSLLGLALKDVFPQRHDAWQAQLSQGLAGQALKVEESVNGKTSTWEIRPWLNEDGNLAGVVLAEIEVVTAPSRLEDPPPVVTPHPAKEETLDLARYLPFGVVVLDRDGTVISHNEMLDSLLGRGLLPSLGVEAWLVSGAPEPLLREAIARDWRDNVWRRQLTRVFSLVGEDGLLKEIELRPRPLNGGRLLVMVSDVTETRRSEEILRASEMKYRGLFREFPIALALADRTGALVEANAALERLSGRTRQELRRLRVDDLLLQARPLATAPGAGEAARHACELAMGEGSRRPVTVTLAPIRNHSGGLVLQSLLIQPAEEEPSTPAPAASTEEASWRELAFENFNAAMLVTDRRGRIHAANPAARRFFGDEESRSLEGKGLFQLFQPDDPKGFSQTVSGSLKAHRRWESETEFVRVDGRRGRCRAEVTPSQDGRGLLCVVQPLFVAALAPH